MFEYFLLSKIWLEINSAKRSGSGFLSNATLIWIFYLVTATCFGLVTIFRQKKQNYLKLQEKEPEII
jgi:hypothetical protein